MSENTEVVEGQEPSEKPNEGQYVSTIEDQAKAQGWVPKNDFDGDEHKWVEPGEFLRRGELFKKIDQQGRQLKQVNDTLKNFQSHYINMQEIANKEALARLKADRKAARDEGDFDKVDAIEERIEEEKEQHANAVAEIKRTVDVPQVPQAVTAWVERNSWYNNNAPMKAYADAVAAAAATRGIIGDALLSEVDSEVRKAFPTKFSNPNRERGSSVESSTNKGSSGRSDDFVLNEQQTRIMNGFVRDKLMTKAEYIADLKKQLGVK